MQDFTFNVGDDKLVGNLFVPDGKAKGVVITTGPLTSVKEQAPGVYAKAMAERGYVALAFDHRYFGESDGQPRQFENPLAKIEDMKAAAHALHADRRFADLPVFAVGICAGAGYMVRAVADDKIFQAFAGVAGVYKDLAQTKEQMGESYQATIDRAKAAEQKWREGAKAETIPAVGPNNGDVAMPLTEAYEYYGTKRGAVANYVNGYAVQANAYTLPFDSQSAAPAITVPVLIVHSERALAPAWAKQFYAAVKAPKQQLWLQSQGQIDFYDDPKLINPAADTIDQFFMSHAAKQS